MYTAPGTAIRLIDEEDGQARVFKAWTPEAWHCDPCAPASQRYTVVHPSGLIVHPWYAVITCFDDARARYVKWSYCNKVIKARQDLERATRAYRDLTR